LSGLFRFIHGLFAQLFLLLTKKIQMKNLTFLTILFFLFNGQVFSQVHPHAIGLRGGAGNFGTGGEVSYQHGLGSGNRLEFDFGWRGNNGNGNNYYHSALTGIYHWVKNITDGLNWYIGPGAQLGFYRDKWNNGNDGVTLALGGQIGLEYDFNQHDIPLLLGLDTRPMFGFIGGVSGIGYGGAFSLRYTF